jgi:hypothetical protein
MTSIITDEQRLNQEEENTYQEEDYFEIPPSDIIAYNEQRSCADLVRMSDKKQLIIDPDFQRDIVWSSAQQTRFIDSLIKQLPIPSMCISLDYKTEKRYIIDGLQRVASIIKFLTQEDWTLSKLSDIDPNISGKKVADIKAEHTELYERVENLTLPITVIRYDSKKTQHNNYLFTIFHRLNTGGTKLNNQEIRNCIYNGIFNNFLKECVQYPNWRVLMNIQDRKVGEKSNRFDSEEFILRFFAFYDNYKNYKGSLTKFLNEYMDKHRNPNPDFLNSKRLLLEKTTDLIYQKVTKGKPLNISKVVAEGLLLGVALNLEHLHNLPTSLVQKKYETLKQSEPFSTRNLEGGIFQKEKVSTRMAETLKIFGS